MASSDVKTVWYRNTQTGNVFEVVKDSDHEKRVTKEQHGDDESGYEPTNERLAPAELKKLQDKPENLPGYAAPNARAGDKATEALAEKDEALASKDAEIEQLKADLAAAKK